MRDERPLLIAAVVLLTCCFCTRGNRQDSDPPSLRNEVAAVAYAKTTEAARATADSYVEELRSAVPVEVPTLVLLDSGVKDWCTSRGCDVAFDYFFGLDGDLPAAMMSLNTLLRRQTVTTSGVDRLGDTELPCAERRYVFERDGQWTARVFWADLTNELASGCAAGVRSSSGGTGEEVVSVRDRDVDRLALLARARGKHRFIVQISVGGTYLTIR